MSLEIIGTGCVTPLGHDLSTVWERLATGDAPEAIPFEPSYFGRTAYHLPIPATPSPLSASLARAPRIRRSSAITLYSVAAGLSALEDAGLEISPLGALAPEVAERTALIFAICSGGVTYTRRFYEKLLTEGPSGASPLLFPETVYNAPASHLAAVLGIDGITYTLVGDACVGLSALDLAQQLLCSDPDVDQCVVVGSEEGDWILGQGYATWRLTARQPRVELHSPRPSGMLLSEGAAAVVVRRPSETPGAIYADSITASCAQKRHTSEQFAALLAKLPEHQPDLVIGSANGTWIDHAEAAALQAALPGVVTYYPKAFLGESLGASALTQVLLGTESLRRRALPGQPAGTLSQVITTTLGLNQQAGATLLRRFS